MLPIVWDYPLSITSESTLCLRCDLLLCCSVFIHATLVFLSLMSAFLEFVYCVSLVFIEHAEARAEAIISETRAHSTDTQEHQIRKCGFSPVFILGRKSPPRPLPRLRR